MKSGNLNFLEPSGPLHTCNETALPFNPITSGKANIERHKFLHVSNNNKMVPEGTIETIFCKDNLSEISVRVSTTGLYRGHFQ